MVEIHHQRLELALAHLAMTDPDVGLRHQLGQISRDFLDVFDFVVHEVSLAAATHLAQDRLADGAVTPLGDEGLDGEALRRRRRDQRQFAQTAERHVQGAWDRCRRECEHMHFRPQSLEFFLIAYAEAMLLIDDDETQILEAGIRVQQSVRGDDDIDGAFLNRFEYRRRFLG